jgi:hypothetical protein
MCSRTRDALERWSVRGSCVIASDTRVDRRGGARHAAVMLAARDRSNVASRSQEKKKLVFD